MTVFSTTILGQASGYTPPLIKITRGEWHPEDPSKTIRHSSGILTECPCKYLDRFTDHGGRIREAYENAVVAAVKKLVPRDAVAIQLHIHVVSMGSGGLLQDAMWLQKLFSQSTLPSHLHLHFVDTLYKTNISFFKTLGNYAQEIVPTGIQLEINAWGSYPELQAALEAQAIKPNLAIGIDTDEGTGDANVYQKTILGGDLEKVLFIQQEPKADGDIIFHVFHRQVFHRLEGSNSEPEHEPFNLSRVDEAARYIETVGASF